MSGEASYPLGCWYVSATSDGVERRLVRRRLLDREVVLYRLESGAIVALENRGPRGALSDFKPAYRLPLETMVHWEGW